MEHIHRVFDQRVQFVYIAVDGNPLTHFAIVYIHVTLEKSVKRKTYFMKPIAGMYLLEIFNQRIESSFAYTFSGMQCNYRATKDDRAWNAFLTQSQLHLDTRKIDTGIEIDVLEIQVLECGQFRSVRSRLGMHWAKDPRDRYQQKRKASIKQLAESRLKSSECSWKKPVDNHRAKRKAAIKEVIDLTERPMPGRYLRQRDM